MAFAPSVNLLRRSTHRNLLERSEENSWNISEGTYTGKGYRIIKTVPNSIVFRI